ncbi:MAG TPA: LysR family transcriptional regulator [Caulobacteraceae bacterium]|jgi:DNA-binding transcriptional LysR family regulator
MLDGLSLDQLRTFIAAADEGSFSAASRKLRRAQSVVSQSIANLEDQIGVELFDRTGRFPKLTAEGAILIADARAIVAGIDGLKARAKGMAQGLEPELSVVIEVMFPMIALTQAAKAFALQFPATPLRLYVETLGAAFLPVVDGRCGLGVVGSLPLMPRGLASERLPSVEMAMMAAADHPLAGYPGPIPKAELARHVQLVLTDRSELSAGREFGVFSPRTWRLADLGAKHAFLLNGLGWGGMPFLAVADDLAAGRLVELNIEDQPGRLVMEMAAVYPADAPPGPAGRWFIERLKQCPDAAESENRRPQRAARA